MPHWLKAQPASRALGQLGTSVYLQRRTGTHTTDAVADAVATASTFFAHRTSCASNAGGAGGGREGCRSLLYLDVFDPHHITLCRLVYSAVKYRNSSRWVSRVLFAHVLSPTFFLPVGGRCPCAQVVKAAADETPLTLAVLRDYIEKELSEEASLTPEAAAKVR